MINPYTIHNGEKLDTIPLKPKMGQVYPLSVLLFSIVLEAQAGAIKQEEEFRGIPRGK